ncbi:hypothetical protein [Labrenzia sp. PHM005]|uniref:hypothetical protein n=1 Tax=Labrenzia sp. PHM005 TaxID=2590016 RepID=UPI00113FE17E|nr:hypothetical protein [Labrenzia sp. PHM005]QDG74435.1 hypothetical protein FJ695_00290 [Labrenzia sp. PHM005]
MVQKVSLMQEVIAEHGRSTDFGGATQGQTIETLTLHGKILKLRQTGPLDFELSHPDGFISKFSLYDLVEAIGDDLCQHAGQRPKDRLP